MKNHDTITIVTYTDEFTEQCAKNIDLKEILSIVLHYKNVISILHNNDDISESLAKLYCETEYQPDDVPDFVRESDAYERLQHAIYEDETYGSYEDQHRLRIQDVL